MKTDRHSSANEHGSTLVVTIGVVATILVLLGVAVGYTQHVSRMSDRSRKIAQAMEVGDGHLEFLFTHWRNISRAPGLRYSAGQPPTNFFFTSDWNPGPAAAPWTSPVPLPNPWPGVPAVIPRPSPGLFPDVPNYTISQYRIQATTPMIEIDPVTEVSTLAANTLPPAAYGPNAWQFSFFYLAAVDVTIPALNNSVTAKVRRVFEKKYDNPWTYAMFYNDDLELHPDAALIIDGPVHTNNNLYIGTSFLTVQDNPTTSVRPPSKVSYAGEYLNGFSPKDTSSHSISVSAPTFPAKLPPAQDSPYLPFGWNLKLTNADGSVNNDSYHELIEQYVSCSTDTTDPLLEVRYYNQAGMKAVIIDPQLTANTAAGATVIPVSNVTGIAVNMILQVGTTPERRTVSAIDCAAKQITLTPALSNTHNSGELVQTGELTTLTANTAAGATQITVANVNNFVSGDTIRVGTIAPETRTISSINSGQSKITVSVGLTNAHNNNELVQAGDITIYNAAGTRVTVGSSGNDRSIYDVVSSAVYPRRSLYDYRENGSVRIADIDINKITVASDAGTMLNFNGVLYVSHTGAVVSTIPSNVVRRGVRLINGYALPVASSNSNAAGLTVVSENPAYIKGNYNTGATSANPPSNTDPAASNVVSGYNRRQAAVIADAITVLSSSWSDAYDSSTNRPSRPAVSTTINAALIAGNVPSSGGNYSGGGENYIRFLEDWNNNSRVFCYWGSMVQLYQSVQAKAAWSGAGNIYKAPLSSRYYWDSNFGETPTSAKPYQGSPPGNLVIAAYLQQQRWYQVY
jgi:hypothetical protein